MHQCVQAALLSMRCNLLASPTCERALLLTAGWASRCGGEAADPLGLGDRCSPLLVGCEGNMPHKAQHGAEAVKFGRAGPQRAAGKVDVSITECFTFPTWKQGEGQNCTGDEFQHRAVSRWLLQRHQRPQRREPRSPPV